MMRAGGGGVSGNGGSAKAGTVKCGETMIVSDRGLIAMSDHPWMGVLWREWRGGGEGFAEGWRYT
jgi:hypothetical protein